MLVNMDNSVILVVFLKIRVWGFLCFCLFLHFSSYFKWNSEFLVRIWILYFFFYPVTVVAFLEISQVSKHFSPKSHTWRIQIFLSSYFHCMSLPCVETSLGVGLNYIANLSGCDQCIYSLFIFHIQVLCKLVWFRVTFQLLYCHIHNVDDSVISLGTFDKLWPTNISWFWGSVIVWSTITIL